LAACYFFKHGGGMT